MPALARGKYDDEYLHVPTRLLAGRGDPVITEDRVRGVEARGDDFKIEFVDGGHFLPEERPDLVADRLLALP